MIKVTVRDIFMLITRIEAEEKNIMRQIQYLMLVESILIDLE